MPGHFHLDEIWVDIGERITMVKNNEKDKVIDEDLINTWKIVIFKSQGYLSCYKMKLQLSVTLYAPYYSHIRTN